MILPSRVKARVAALLGWCLGAIAYALIVSVLSGCAPSMRLAGRCPTLAPLAVDFAATGVLLAGSVLKYNEGDTVDAIALAGGGMTVALAANVSECRR